MPAQYQVGDTVQVVKLLDETTSKDLIGFTGKVDEVDPLPNGDFNYYVGGHYMHEEELRRVIPEDKLVVHQLLVSLRSLEAVVGHLSRLYLAHPELNEQVDIKSIIPMSLDEWEAEIEAKVDQISGANDVRV